MKKTFMKFILVLLFMWVNFFIVSSKSPTKASSVQDTENLPSSVYLFPPYCSAAGESCNTVSDCCFSDNQECYSGVCIPKDNIVLNSATGKSCVDVCYYLGSNYQSENVISVGTNPEADNQKMYSFVGGVCSEYSISNSRVMDAEAAYCEGNQNKWTNCNCLPNPNLNPELVLLPFEITNNNYIIGWGYGSNFFTRVFEINFSGENIMLSSNPDGTGDTWVDDAIEINVTHEDGSGATPLVHDYSQGCSGTTYPQEPISLSHMFEPGRNYVSVRLYDICGELHGSSSLWLSSSTGFLEFPVDYDDFVVASSLQDIVPNGLIRTRVDHDQTNVAYRPYTGESYLPKPAYGDGHCTRLDCYNNADAIDIGDQYGTNVYASYTGEVIDLRNTCVKYVNPCTGWGNYVLIDHGNCYRTRYSHLESVSSEIAEGVTVSTLQFIGIMGKTGNASGVHLDFQVRHDPDCDGNWIRQGEIVDPFGWNPYSPAFLDPDPLTTNTEYLWVNSQENRTNIGSLGGTAYGPNDDFQVYVPPGSVDDDITLEVSATSLPDLPVSGWWSILTTYWFRVLEWLGETNHIQFVNQFNTPVDVLMKYADENLDHVDEFSISIHVWDDSTQTWMALPSTLETISNTVTTETLVPGIFSLQAQVLCGDTTEPNDHWSSATQVVFDGIVTGTFDIATDEDWYVFEIDAGETVSVFSNNVNSNEGFLLELYENGNDFIDSSDIGIIFSAPKDQNKTLWIRVIPQPGSSIGCDSSYSFILADNHVYLPMTIR